MNRAPWSYNESVQGAPDSSGRAGFWLAAAQHKLIAGFERIGDWQERIAQRRRLMTMDQRMLHDIGLCREDAINEAMKPFWKA